jgi:DHA3 family macrolide efflux protein-like MFS transporter
MNQTMNGVLNIVGPPLGALLLELLPLHSIMLVDVGTATLAISPLLFVHIPQPRRDDTGAAKASLWSDMRAGLRYIGDWPGLVALITSAMILKIALTPAFSLLPLLVSQHFNGDAAQLSLLEVVAGVGIILGGLLLSVWGGFKRKIYTTMTGMLILASSLVVLGLTPASVFELALVSVLGVGLMIPLIDGPIMAILQSTVAPEMQGRVFTLMSSLVWITSPFSLAVAGPVSDGLGLQVWYVLAGLLCGLVGLAGFFVPAIVNIEENANRGVAAAESAVLVEAQV